jgi:hypothetical protein
MARCNIRFNLAVIGSYVSDRPVVRPADRPAALRIGAGLSNADSSPRQANALTIAVALAIAA